MKKEKFSYSLNSADGKAILAALPLVLIYSEIVYSDAQYEINARVGQSVMEKLLNGKADFLPNEIRIMGCAVFIAYDVLRGDLPLDLTDEERNAITPYLFTYNKLYPIFEQYFPDR